jgi:hypothetical protein
MATWLYSLPEVSLVSANNGKLRKRVDTKLSNKYKNSDG